MPSPIEVSLEKSLIVQRITEQMGVCASGNGKALDYKTCVVLVKDDRPYMVISPENYATHTEKSLAWFESKGITFQTKRLRS